MNNEIKLKQLIERAEVEYYSTDGISVQILNNVAKLCLNNIKTLPALGNDDLEQQKTYEDILKHTGSRDFTNVLINDISDQLRQKGIGILDSRKFLLKIALCARTHYVGVEELLFIFADSVLDGRYENYSAENIIDDVLVDKRNTSKYIDMLNGIHVKPTEMLLFVIKVAMVALLIAVIVKFVMSFRNYILLKRDMNRVHERFMMLKHE